MTLIPPVPPIIPSVVPYTRPTNIVPVVTPLTYRDGVTLLEIVNGMSDYIVDTLIPFINTSFDALEDKWADDMMNLLTALNAALVAQAEDINAALVQQQTNVQNALDAQQETVNDQLEANAAAMTALGQYVDNSVADLTQFVNEQVAALTALVNSTEFQDENVRDIIADTGSLTRALLDTLYSGGGGGTGSDADTAGFITTVGTQTRTALDNLYIAETELDAKSAALINGTSATATAVDNKTAANVNAPASATGTAVRNVVNAAVAAAFDDYDWFMYDNGRRPFNSSNFAIANGAKMQGCSSPNTWKLTGAAWYWGSAFQLPTPTAAVQKALLTTEINASQPNFDAGFSINVTGVGANAGIYFGQTYDDAGQNGIIITTDPANIRNLIVKKMVAGVVTNISTIANAFAVGGPVTPDVFEYVKITSRNYGDTFTVTTAFKGATVVDIDSALSGNFGSVGLYTSVAANQTADAFITDVYFREFD